MRAQTICVQGGVALADVNDSEGAGSNAADLARALWGKTAHGSADEPTGLHAALLYTGAPAGTQPNVRLQTQKQVCASHRPPAHHIAPLLHMRCHRP